MMQVKTEIGENYQTIKEEMEDSRHTTFAKQIPSGLVVHKISDKSPSKNNKNKRVTRSATASARPKVSEIIFQEPKAIQTKSRVIQTSKNNAIKLPSSCVLRKIDPLSIKPTSASIPSIKIASFAKLNPTANVAAKGIKTSTGTKNVSSLVGIVPDKIHTPSDNPENAVDMTTMFDVFADLKEEPSKSDDEEEVVHEEIMKFPSNVYEHPKEFVCEICFKEFTSKFRYQKHIKMIHRNNEMQYLCPMCTEKFSVYRSLLRHVRDHRGTRATYDYSVICDICGSVKKSRWDLEEHQRTHSEKRDFKCHICTASFKTKYQLKTHLERHAGVKKYKCDLCEAAFFDCADYKRHLAKHGLLEKNFHCSICDSKFYERKLLRYHLKKVHSICDGDEQKFLPEVNTTNQNRYVFIARPPRKVKPAKPSKPQREPRKKPQELNEQGETAANSEGGRGSDNESYHSETSDDFQDQDDDNDFDAQKILNKLILNSSNVPNKPEELIEICNQIVDVIVTLKECAIGLSSLNIVEESLRSIIDSSELFTFCDTEIQSIYRQIGEIVAEIQNLVQKKFKKKRASKKVSDYLPLNDIDPLERKLHSKTFKHEFVKYFKKTYPGTSPHNFMDIEKVLSVSLIEQFVNNTQNFDNCKRLMITLYEIWKKECKSYEDFEQVMRVQLTKATSECMKAQVTQFNI